MICDLAETYQILDYKKVPVELLGTLVAGLGQRSRVRMKRDGVKAPPETIILAGILDDFNAWLCANAEGAEKPQSIALEFYEEEQDEQQVVTFDTPEDFERERARIMRRYSNE